MSKPWSLKDLAGLNPRALAQLEAQGVTLEPVEIIYDSNGEAITIDQLEEIGFKQPVKAFCRNDSFIYVGGYGLFYACKLMYSCLEYVTYELPFPKGKNRTVYTSPENIERR